jgi:hypothetical protein
MSTPEVHSERFVQLAELSHDRALVAWGAFCFVRDDPRHRWKIVDDERLHEVVGRRTCIGSAAEPFGPAAVRVLDGDGVVVTETSTEDRTWVWVTGLRPDAETPPVRFAAVGDYGVGIRSDSEHNFQRAGGGRDPADPRLGPPAGRWPASDDRADPGQRGGGAALGGPERVSHAGA